MGCSLPIPLDLISTKWPPYMPTFPELLNHLRKLVPVNHTHHTSPSFLNEGQSGEFSRLILWRHRSFIHSTERGRHCKGGRYMCPYFSWTSYKPQGTLQVTWINPHHECNQMGSVSTCGTVLNDVRTNPLWQKRPFSVIYLPQGRFAFYLTLTLFYREWRSLNSMLPGELSVKPSVISTAARTILILLAALVTENSLCTSCTA